MMLLFVIRQLSDEPYKINAAKVYMVDYLENICSCRFKKQRTAEKDAINVIAAENMSKTAPQKEEPVLSKAERDSTERPGADLSINIEGEPRDAKKGEAARQVIRRTVKEKLSEEDQPTLKEEAIRQILEEFLA